MAEKKKIEVELDVKSNIEPSLKQLRELKKQLKDTAAGSAEFKKIANEIDDLEDKLKGAKAGAADWIDTLASAGGPLGLLGKGINNVKVAFSSFNTALKASIIGIIVTAVGGLVAAFSQSEVAMKKLQPIFIAFEKILGGIFRAMEPLLDIFIELAMQVLPVITKGIGLFYSGLFGLFSFIKNTGIGIAKILQGIFTLDFDKATEGFNQLKNSVSDAASAATEAYGRFQSGTKELTKTEKEELEKRNAANKAANDARDKQNKEALEKKKKDLDAQIQLEINKENTSKEQLQKLLEQRLQAELQSEKRSEAEKELLRQEYAKKLQEALAEDEKKKEEERVKNQEKRAKELDALIQLEIEKGNTSKEALQKILDERLQLELSNTQLSEAEKEVIRNSYRKKLDDAIKEDSEKRKKERIDELQEQLVAANGNAQEQLLVYQQLQQELTNNTAYSEEERANLRKQYQDAILQTLDAGFRAEIQATENKYGEFARFDKDYYDEARRQQDEYLANLKKTFDSGAITQTQYNERLAGTSKARRDLDKLEVQSKRDTVGAIGNALGQLSDLVGKDTVAGKAFAIAKATIDTYQSATSAYASLVGIPVVGPVLAAIAAAAAVAQGIATVKKIVQVQVPGGGAGATSGSPIQSTPTGPAPGSSPQAPIQVNARRFADGGFVRGPGTSTSDSIPSLLSDGEFVVNARSTQLFKPLLQAINEAGSLPTFAVGGLVDGKMKREPDNSERLAQAIQQTLGQQPIRTYVTAADISSQQQFDRVIKSRSLI